VDRMTGTRRIVRSVVVPVIAAVALAATGRDGWPQAPAPPGEVAGRDTGLSRHASHEGSYWQALSGQEKDSYVREFLAGALSDQVRAIAVAGHGGAGAAVPTDVRDRIVDSLRASHAVRFPFAATVYVAQLDDFYWWQDHMAVPVDEALQRINAQMETQQSRP
jgi:hypothetical protein